MASVKSFVHGILVAFVLGVGPTVAAGQTDGGRLAAAIAAPVNNALQAGRIAGLRVAVMRGNDTLFDGAFGKADLELGVPMPESAVFEIGSMTKQFTAAAVLRLAQDGKLKLDDDIATYLPMTGRARGATIRRLLDHTAGVVSFGVSRPEFRRMMVLPVNKDSMAGYYATLPLDFPPGSSIAYSNTGYFLLGLLIEKVAGMSYARYLDQALFRPAGMRSTRYCDQGAIIPNRAHGYSGSAEGLTRAPHFEYDAWFAAGAVCSTASDLMSWSRALHGGNILAPSWYRELVTPGRLTDGTPLRYAKGFRVSDIAGHRAIHHGGALAGFASEMAFLPDDSLTVVVLMNTLSPTVRPVTILEGIVRQVAGSKRPKASPLPLAAAAYAGEYAGRRDGKEARLLVSADSGTVLIRNESSRPVALIHMGNGVFGRAGDNTRWVFVTENGKVARVHIDDVSTMWTAERLP